MEPAKLQIDIFKHHDVASENRQASIVESRIVSKGGGQFMDKTTRTWQALTLRPTESSTQHPILKCDQDSRTHPRPAAFQSRRCGIRFCTPTHQLNGYSKMARCSFSCVPVGPFCGGRTTFALVVATTCIHSFLVVSIGI